MNNKYLNYYKMNKNLISSNIKFYMISNKIIEKLKKQIMIYLFNRLKQKKSIKQKQVQLKNLLIKRKLFMIYLELTIQRFRKIKIKLNYLSMIFHNFIKNNLMKKYIHKS